MTVSSQNIADPHMKSDNNPSKGEFAGFTGNIGASFQNQMHESDRFGDDGSKKSK